MGSRPGLLHVLCKFRGLEKFPGDRLICALEFGSWSYNSDDVDLYFRHADDGFVFPGKTGLKPGSTSETAGSSFQAFDITDICVHRVVKTFDCCEGSWPSLIYVLRLNRSSTFYV